MAKLAGDDRIRYSTWADVAHETFKHYGRFKAEIRRQMNVVRSNDLLLVEVAGRIIYWPPGADCSRLADMYFEVFQARNNHYFTIPETRVQPGDVVLDCGACEGYFTLKALEDGADRVFCIEPGKAITTCLQRTFSSEIADGRVLLQACLLGDRVEEVMFCEHAGDPTIGSFYAPQSAAPQGDVRAVQMTTVDELCLSRQIGKIDFIKADVEGGEVGLLRGAEKTLKQFKPRLALAAYHNPDDANQMVEYLKGLDLGYRFRVKGIVNYENVPRPVMVHCF